MHFLCVLLLSLGGCTQPQPTPCACILLLPFAGAAGVGDLTAGIAVHGVQGCAAEGAAPYRASRAHGEWRGHHHQRIGRLQSSSGKHCGAVCLQPSLARISLALCRQTIFIDDASDASRAVCASPVNELYIRTFFNRLIPGKTDSDLTSARGASLPAAYLESCRYKRKLKIKVQEHAPCMRSLRAVLHHLAWSKH